MRAQDMLLQASKQARDNSARFEVSSEEKRSPRAHSALRKAGCALFVVRKNVRTGEKGEERAMKKGIWGLACLLALAALLLLHFGWQKWKGKAPSPIAMILVSAVLGMGVYH